ncbi:permease [Streptomyces sp. TRM76323]|uniref:Permease n=1 Tax=Streptomyces tamarix TaxID=3078565 RepID=A0ABU3QMQ7_9ACTN|nr:permease [Streptomyces tamarix]MDT9683734.1 permease [Streptomyces tamarix]
MIEPVVDVLGRVAQDVWSTFTHNWPFLLISVVVASAISVYVGADRLSSWLRRKTWIAVFGAVTLAVLTPFCSCGTTAVVLGALASSVPWAPVVAFMVSSPLTSPEEYVYSTGLFGFSFATTFFVASIVLGLAAGGITHLIEKTGWLKGQARVVSPEEASCCGTEDKAAPKAESDGCCGSSDEGGLGGGSATVPAGGGGLARTALLERIEVKPAAPEPEVTLVSKYKLDEFGVTLWKNTRRLALFFFGFAALGYLLIETIPTSVLTNYLGEGSILAVPLAALIGIPVYLNSDGSLPLVATLMQGGMGPGAALAFLITGAGTSIGAISGMFVIARKKIVGLVVGFLFGGAVLAGYLAPMWL